MLDLTLRQDMSTHESNLTKYFNKILPMSSSVQSEYVGTAEW